MSGTGVIVAFAHDGRERWRRNLQEDYGPFGQQFGFASSPLLLDGALYVPVIHGMHTNATSYLVRLDGETGKSAWRVERRSSAVRESRDAYSTPAVLERGTGRAIVVSGADVVTAHDPLTGRELWRIGGLNPDNRPYHQVITSPFVTGDHLIVPSRSSPVLSYRLGGLVVEPPTASWSFDRGADVPTPVSDGTYVYVLSDGGILQAIELATGLLVYGPERLQAGPYTASLVLGDGRLYATNEECTTTVIQAGPRFAVLAENRLAGQCLSSMALSRGQIFIRTTGFLWAIGTARARQ
jgi:outer membrane protein assembly factor BamB